jgi:hypothetical protein
MRIDRRTFGRMCRNCRLPASECRKSNLDVTDSVKIRRLNCGKPRRSDCLLTSVTNSVTLSESRSRKGRLPEGRPEDGASAVPAGGVTIRTRAVSGIVPAGIKTGLRGAR